MRKKKKMLEMLIIERISRISFDGDIKERIENTINPQTKDFERGKKHHN